MRVVKWLSLTLIVMLAMSSHASAQAAPEPKRPNVLFFLIDDMGYRDLSCFGGERAKTPNIDRLAKEGLRFDQFYVASPICSPSRVGFTTGQYPARWNITTFLSNRNENRERGEADWLDPAAPTLPRILSKNGYYTAHVGKWHMGGQRDVNDAPQITEYGFATSLTSMEGLGDRILPNWKPKPDGQPFNHGPTESNAKHGGPGAQRVDRENVSAAYVDRAIVEVQKAQEQNKPFYINLWPDDVHSPFQTTDDRAGDGSPGAQYVGVLEELDEQVGRIFDVIRSDPKLRDNTIILVASDNGHERGAGSASTLRGTKGQLYEGGIRSPLIVWAPGLIPAAVNGTHNEKTVMQAIDVAPSVLALANIPTPADVKFDGLDLSQQMVGKSTAPRGAPVMWVRPSDRPGPQNSLPDLAIRDGNWKLLVDRDGSNVELFDVIQDPDETMNLAEKHPDVVAKLRAKVIAWDKSVNDNPSAVSAAAPVTAE